MQQPLFEAIRPDVDRQRNYYGLVFDKDNTLEPRDTWRQSESIRVISELIGREVPHDACRFLIGITEAKGNELLNEKFAAYYREKLKDDRAKELCRFVPSGAPDVFNLSTADLEAIDLEVANFAKRFREIRKDRESVAISTGTLVPYPGTNDFLSMLAENTIPFGIATQSKGPDRENLINHKFFGLAAIAALTSSKTWVTSDEVHRAKPYPNLYLEAVDRINAHYFGSNPKDPGQFFAVEDSDTGVMSALSAGMPVIFVDHGDGQPLESALMRRVHYKAFGIAGVQAIAQKHIMGLKNL